MTEPQSFHGSIGGKQSVDQQTWYATLVYRIVCVGVFIAQLGGKYFHKPKASENAAHVITSHTIEC